MRSSGINRRDNHRRQNRSRYRRSHGASDRSAPGECRHVARPLQRSLRAQIPLTTSARFCSSLQARRRSGHLQGGLPRTITLLQVLEQISVGPAEIELFLADAQVPPDLARSTRPGWRGRDGGSGPVPPRARASSAPPIRSGARVRVTIPVARWRMGDVGVRDVENLPVVGHAANEDVLCGWPTLR